MQYSVVAVVVSVCVILVLLVHAVRVLSKAFRHLSVTVLLLLEELMLLLRPISSHSHVVAVDDLEFTLVNQVLQDLVRLAVVLVLLRQLLNTCSETSDLLSLAFSLLFSEPFLFSSFSNLSFGASALGANLHHVVASASDSYSQKQG